MDQLDQIAVSGRVRTADGAPIEGAAVTLTVADGRGQIADGSFRHAHLSGGQYTLVVAAAPYAPVAVQVAVEGRAGRRDVQLPASGRVAGTVLTAGGLRKQAAG